MGIASSVTSFRYRSTHPTPEWTLWFYSVNSQILEILIQTIIHNSDGVDEGLKHESSIHCDELVSLLKSVLTNFIGTLPSKKIQALNEALQIALEI